MRRKHLILASCIISALLLTFTFYVSADENVTADAGASSNSAPLLDSYFWDNYYILPYIVSDGTQYIDTGINPSQDLELNAKISDVVYSVTDRLYVLFGAAQDDQYFSLGTYLNPYDNLSYRAFRFSNGTSSSIIDFLNYRIFDFNIYDGSLYINNQLSSTISSELTSLSNSIYIFGVNNTSGVSNMTSYKLYSFYLYDHSIVNDEEVGYVRYYYPAKSKSGNIVGLYDAVSKTFVSSGSSSPFTSPTEDKEIHFQIGNFIESGLGWIGDILDFAIQEPMILMFMAIGLCGVAFRWARRVVHF